MKMPTSRTFVDGSTWSAPTRTGVVGSAGDVRSCTRESRSSRYLGFIAVICLSSSSPKHHLDKWTGLGRLELSDRPRVTGALDLRVISIQMRSTNPAVYRMKRRGPRTDPCGTPNQTVVSVDRSEPRLTHSALCVK